MDITRRRCWGADDAPIPPVCRKPMEPGGSRGALSGLVDERRDIAGCRPGWADIVEFLPRPPAQALEKTRGNPRSIALFPPGPWFYYRRAAGRMPSQPRDAVRAARRRGRGTRPDRVIDHLVERFAPCCRTPAPGGKMMPPHFSDRGPCLRRWREISAAPRGVTQPPAGGVSFSTHVRPRRVDEVVRSRACATARQAFFIEQGATTMPAVTNEARSIIDAPNVRRGLCTTSASLFRSLCG